LLELIIHIIIINITIIIIYIIIITFYIIIIEVIIITIIIEIIFINIRIIFMNIRIIIIIWGYIISTIRWYTTITGYMFPFSLAYGFKFKLDLLNLFDTFIDFLL